LNGLNAIACFSNNCNVGLVVENAPKSATDERVVVDE
jgi:hypothetical protein